MEIYILSRGLTKTLPQSHNAASKSPLTSVTVQPQSSLSSAAFAPIAPSTPSAPSTFSMCPSLTTFVRQTSRPRSTSRKRSSKPLPTAQSPVSLRTRAGLKRTASLGDLRQADQETVEMSGSQPEFTSDKCLRAIREQVKLRKDKRGKLSSPIKP